MRRHYLSITLLAVLGWSVDAQAQQGGRQMPRLIVNIVIDQLRSDYMESFAASYGPGGFKKLLSQGLVYENAAYPFTGVDRASAAATLITGTTPFYHSIIGEQWLDRISLRPMRCTDDPLHPGVASPTQLAVSTIGDEMKAASNGEAKIFSIAPIQSIAVLLAGHAADGAIWMEEQKGEWVGLSYYSEMTPNWVASYNAAKTPRKKLEWLPYSDVQQKHPDFKHVLKGDKRFLQYRTSGLINADITSLALACVDQEKLGTDETTDLLNITYYAGPYDHQPLTTCQRELADTYRRLDQTLDSLITYLEHQIGADNLLLIVTSTGYSDPEGTNYAKYRIPTGNFYINRAANLLNMYFSALWGQGRYVEGSHNNELFLNHKLLESKRISLGDASQRAQEFIGQMAGVKNVRTSLQLLYSSNDELQKTKNGFNVQHSGDIQIEVAPGWHVQNEDTGYDKLSQSSAIVFPIIVYGSNIPFARVLQQVTVDKIAPAIAKSIRIRAPNACTSEPLF